ncbi:hypothetical protein HUK83_11920 [Endobacter medicaginis]|uniref:Uncharacterized protein n=1 Tax=Endobacter medicaginis TaxID=1181271 RepID=A0A850NW24_9PROT|nr:hypothetical protein [Endobacter medicaginis]NVN31038.1 hypothetical protein [Endobacter medicaginis]
MQYAGAADGVVRAAKQRGLRRQPEGQAGIFGCGQAGIGGEAGDPTEPGEDRVVAAIAEAVAEDGLAGEGGGPAARECGGRSGRQPGQAGRGGEQGAATGRDDGRHDEALPVNAVCDAA